MTARLFGALRNYYDQHGIGAQQFLCAHANDCSRGRTEFTTAKEAYVGRRFGMDGLPRLVFLSLDSGDGGKRGWQGRTMEHLQQHEETVVIDKLHKNLHWYQTRELALTLLSPLMPGLSIHTVHQYFAHTNSAKCCLNLPGRSMASRRLFDNCRPYIPGELAILAPAILVTQGRWARAAVSAGFEGRISEPQRMPSGSGLHRVVSIHSPNSTIWLHSHHPRFFGGYSKQKKQEWPVWRELIRRRFGASSLGSVLP